MALVQRNDHPERQLNHMGGFSSGHEDQEKVDSRENYPRRGGGGGGGFQNGRRGGRPNDSIHYGSRYVMRSRRRDDENLPSDRRRSYSDGHGVDTVHDEAAGGDRRSGYERRRPRAFGGGFDQQQHVPYTGGRGGYRYSGYRGGFQTRRRFRDDDEERHQQRRPPLRSARNRDPSSDAQRSENEKDIGCTMLPPHEFPKHFYSVKIGNLPANKSVKGLYHHYKCFGSKVLNIYVMPDVNDEESKTTDKPQEGEVESEKKTSTEPNDSLDNEQNKENVDKEKGAADQDKSSTVDNEKSQTVIVSFDSWRGSQAVERGPRTVFGRKLQVSRFIPDHLMKKERTTKPANNNAGSTDTAKQGSDEHHSAPRHGKRRSRDSPSDKHHNMGRFGEDILVHMFGLMDMKTRGKASSVCRLWHQTMQKVAIPAPDLPADLKVVIQKADYEARQRPVILQTLNKESGTLTVSYRRPLRAYDQSLERHVERLARQLAPAVHQLELRKVAVSEYLLVTLGAFQNVVNVAFDECFTVGRVDLGLLLSFFTHFSSKLSFTPRYEPLPPPSFSSRTKKRVTSSHQRRSAGGAKSAASKEADAKTAADAVVQNVSPPPVPAEENVAPAVAAE